MDQNTNSRPSPGGDSQPRQNSGPRPTGGGGNYNQGRYNNRRRKPRPHNPSAAVQGGAQPGAQGGAQPGAAQAAAQGAPRQGVQDGVKQPGVQGGARVNAQAGSQPPRQQSQGGAPSHPRPATNDRPPQNPQQTQIRPADRAPRPANAATGNAGPNRPAPAQQQQQQANPYRSDRPARNWQDHKVKIEETLDDVRKDNERIEKEIWLEIAEIHNMRID